MVTIDRFQNSVPRQFVYRRERWKGAVKIPETELSAAADGIPAPGYNVPAIYFGCLSMFVVDRGNEKRSHSNAQPAQS